MKLAVTSASFSKSDVLINELKTFWTGSIKLNKEGIRFSKEELIEYLSDVDAAIVGLDSISEEVLEKLPNLKYISKYGVGLDNIDLNACKQRGISIGWTGGVNKLSVAEMTLGFALSLTRNLFQSSILLKGGEWKKNGGSLLSNKTVGIIGFGHVGKEVYRLLEPFNCNILVNDINNEAFEGYDIKNTSKEEIYSNSDVITIHTPLTEQTESLLSLEQFKMMKRKPVVINTARGGIVNEEEVILALDSNMISSFAIDAYTSEPNPERTLVERPDVFCTPHIGGNAKEAVKLMGITAINNLKEIVNE